MAPNPGDYQAKTTWRYHCSTYGGSDLPGESSGAAYGIHRRCECGRGTESSTVAVARDMELTNHVALITGGTAGIGLESARLMARGCAGHHHRPRHRPWRKAVADIGGDVRFVPADLSDLESVAALVAQAGPVDIIVNNRGWTGPAAARAHR